MSGNVTHADCYPWGFRHISPRERPRETYTAQPLWQRAYGCGVAAAPRGINQESPPRPRHGMVMGGNLFGVSATGATSGHVEELNRRGGGYACG